MGGGGGGRISLGSVPTMTTAVLSSSAGASSSPPPSAVEDGDDARGSCAAAISSASDRIWGSRSLGATFYASKRRRPSHPSTYTEEEREKDREKSRGGDRYYISGPVNLLRCAPPPPRSASLPLLRCPAPLFILLTRFFGSLLPARRDNAGGDAGENGYGSERGRRNDEGDDTRSPVGGGGGEKRSPRFSSLSPAPPRRRRLFLRRGTAQTRASPPLAAAAQERGRLVPVRCRRIRRFVSRRRRPPPRFESRGRGRGVGDRNSAREGIRAHGAPITTRTV